MRLGKDAEPTGSELDRKLREASESSRAGDPDRARSILHDLLSRDPPDAEKCLVCIYLADVHERLGEEEEALRWYDAAAGYDRDFAAERKAGYLARTGRLEESRALYEELLESPRLSKPERAGVRFRRDFSRGFELEGGGDRPAAIAFFEERLSGDYPAAEKAMICTSIADLHADLGDEEAALEWYDRAISYEREAGSFAAIEAKADYLRELGRRRESRKLYGELLARTDLPEEDRARIERSGRGRLASLPLSLKVALVVAALVLAVAAAPITFLVAAALLVVSPVAMVVQWFRGRDYLGWLMVFQVSVVAFFVFLFVSQALFR
jgi:tetratricopeptide (TPR) repeat protein